MSTPPARSWKWSLSPLFVTSHFSNTLTDPNLIVSVLPDAANLPVVVFTSAIGNARPGYITTV